MSILLIAETFEEPEATAPVSGIPSAPVFAIPIVPISAIPTIPASTIPTTPISTVPAVPAPVLATPATSILTSLGMFSSSHPLLHFFIKSSSFLLQGFSHRVACSLSGLILTAPSQFEVGNSFATILDLVSEAITFFTRFDQHEVNDLDPADFWGSGPPYVDFHGFRVLKDCASHLEVVYSSRGDFMQGFLLGRSSKEHFLELLGSAMNNIEHNFVDTISAEQILQWRVAVQELVSMGFAMKFILDHLHEIAQAFFMKKVQPAVDAIDSCIEALRKQVADLKGRREHLLSNIGRSNHFGDQPFFSRLR